MSWGRGGVMVARKGNLQRSEPELTGADAFAYHASRAAMRSDWIFPLTWIGLWPS